jgi:hypothetical protein
LEAITNRTAEQEAELRSLKEKLAKLEQQEGGLKKYLPWKIGGGIVLILLVIIIVYRLGKSNKKRKVRI